MRALHALVNPAERNYAAWKGELLAVIHGLKAFRPYLLSREFTLVTDHRALLWLLTHKQPVGQQARWLLSISEFRFSLQHRAGVDNPADLPSREPQACAADWTGSRLDGPADVMQLPAVRLADGSPDPALYSHDQLALELCVRPPPKPRSSSTRGGAHQAAAAQWGPDAYTAALAAAVSAQRPSAIMAAEASVCPPSHPWSQQAERQLFQLLDISEAAGGGVGSFMLSPASLTGGGEDPALPTSFLAAAASQLNHSNSAISGAHQPASAISGAQQPNSAISGAHQPASAISGARQPTNGGGTPTDRSPAVAWEQQQLRRAAATWVHQAVSAPAPSAGQQQPPLTASYVGKADSNGVRRTERLSTAPVVGTFFPAAIQQGIVLYEPCGGLCAALETALRNGIKVSRYLYSDIDSAARRVAAHRVRQLSSKYPDLLDPSALESSFSTLPADVTQVTSQHLAAAVQQHPDLQWLVVAGWPCQDYSTARQGRGREGSRAQLLHNVVYITGALQQLCPALPPAYLLANVALQHNQNPRVSRDAYQQVCGMIGQPVYVDAAQFGSLAHRPRNFWSNLWGCLTCVGRTSCVGRLPLCRDHLAATSAWHCSRAGWHSRSCGQTEHRSIPATSLVSSEPWGSAAAAAAAPATPATAPCAARSTQHAAAAHEALAAGTAGSSEVWTDHPTLTALQQGQLPPGLSHAERTRVQKRLKLYLWDHQHQQLLRRMPDGSRRSVPPPQQRQQLVQQQHELGGHFGSRRTATMLATKHWWHGMLSDVEAVVSKCSSQDGAITVTCRGVFDGLSSLTVTSTLKANTANSLVGSATSSQVVAFACCSAANTVARAVSASSTGSSCLTCGAAGAVKAVLLRGGLDSGVLRSGAISNATCSSAGADVGVISASCDADSRLLRVAVSLAPGSSAALQYTRCNVPVTLRTQSGYNLPTTHLQSDL